MMTTKPGVLITGGDFQGLAVLRTFGEKNIPTVLIDHEHCIARYSKYRKRFFRSPDPSEESSYVEFLVGLARREGMDGWVLIPNSDRIVDVVSRNRDVLENHYRVPVPHWDIIKNVYVKENTYKVAKNTGIPIPETFYSSSLEELLGKEFRYPVIIKPSIRDNFYSKIKIKAFLIENEKQLIETYKSVSHTIDKNEILVQEYIPGGPENLYSFCPFFKEGKTIASIMARRVRQHPMDFGHATTYAELVDIPEMRELGEQFLSSINYYGIAEVEFMMDPRDKRYKLIEINPRVWGWHALAIYAGVDLPYYLYQDMVGEQVNASSVLRDVRWVRYITDIPTVLGEVVKGRMKIGEYLRTMSKPKRDAVLALDDPLPFFIELLISPYLWLKRGF